MYVVLIKSKTTVNLHIYDFNNSLTYSCCMDVPCTLNYNLGDIATTSTEVSGFGRQKGHLEIY